MAAVGCLLLLQWVIILGESTSLHNRPAVAVYDPSLPATSALLRRWWNNETLIATSLAQHVVLDVAALMVDPELPASQRERECWTMIATTQRGEDQCSCDGPLSHAAASSVLCGLCRRTRLHVRSSSSSSLQKSPSLESTHPLPLATLAKVDVALSSLFSASASSAPPHPLHCPALADSFRQFARLHHTLLSHPSQLLHLFPLLPTTSSSSTPTLSQPLPPSSASLLAPTTPSADDVLFHLSRLTDPTWHSALSGGGGGGGLGYLVRCDSIDGRSALLWSMGGGGGGGYRASSKRVGDSWRARWRGGGGGGAGLQWDGYSVGGGGGGGQRYEALFSSSSTPRFTAINVSRGAQPDATIRRPPPDASLVSLNRTLASRMRHCIRVGHTLRISGAGGAGGGHQLRVRVRVGDEDTEEQVELVSRLHHTLSFHFELAIDRGALMAGSKGRRRAEQ